MKKKRIISVLAIIVSLPLAVAFAASQNFLMGALFGFILALGIDELISTFKHERKLLS